MVRTPNHARAGPVWRFLPLQASPRPPPAEYVHSSRCVQQYQYVSYSRTCVGTEVQCSDFYFLRFSAIPGSERSVPGRAFPRLPLADPVMGTRSFAGITEGCCMGRAWHQPETAGGRVEVGTRICILGMLQQECFQRSK